jgi:hypothetical protein
LKEENPLVVMHQMDVPERTQLRGGTGVSSKFAVSTMFPFIVKVSEVDAPV